MLRLAVAENQRQNFAAIALHPIGAGLSLTERNHAGGDNMPVVTNSSLNGMSCHARAQV